MSAIQALFQVANSALSAPTNLNGTNTRVNGTDNATNSPLPITALTLTSLSSIIPLLFGIPALGDWLKLFLLGGLLESFRRFASTLWQYFIDSFWLTVHFEGNDSAYDWMMIWLSTQPTYRRARSLQVSTSSFGLNSRAVAIPGEQLDAKSNQDGETRSIGFLPAFGTTQTLFYKGHWMRITRNERVLSDSYNYVQESLTVTVLSYSHKVLSSLLLEAKQCYEKEDQHRIAIYIADQYNSWHRSGSRPKRDMESIILEDGIKEMLLDDARDFMSSEEWYNERGIPFRRGYLLHGVPGSGKTSVIHGLAGALNLDIYVISLAKRGLDDTVLNELICDLPARCIALMEDIDAAFTHSVSRDPKSDKTTTVDSGGESSGHAGVTLSGLLGAIDGVAAQEGRLLFATTNKYKVLDPALCRPGRMDIHVEFGLASQYQAEQLFVRFYPATDDESAEKKRAAEAALVELPLNDNEKTPLLANGSSAVAKPLYVKKIATKITSAARLAYAQEFASKIPQHELSMSAIQGHLLNYKTRPVEAVATTEAFVEAERERARKRTGVEQEKPEPSEASAAVVEVPEEKGKVEEEKPKAADVEPANGVAS